MGDGVSGYGRPGCSTSGADGRLKEVNGYRSKDLTLSASNDEERRVPSPWLRDLRRLPRRRGRVEHGDSVPGQPRPAAKRLEGACSVPGSSLPGAGAAGSTPTRCLIVLIRRRQTH